jgi:hypothetical protein
MATLSPTITPMLAQSQFALESEEASVVESSSLVAILQMLLNSLASVLPVQTFMVSHNLTTKSWISKFRTWAGMTKTITETLQEVTILPIRLMEIHQARLLLR